MPKWIIHALLENLSVWIELESDPLFKKFYIMHYNLLHKQLNI